MKSAKIVKGESRGKTIYCFDMTEPHNLRYEKRQDSKRRESRQNFRGRDVKKFAE